MTNNKLHKTTGKFGFRRCFWV